MKIFITIFSGFVMLVVNIQAHAQWYFGGAITQPESDQSVIFDTPPATDTDDGPDVTWKLFGGYNFSPGFAVEIGYSDLGDEYTTFNVLGSNERTTMDVRAVYASFLGRANVDEHVDFFGRLGMALWEVDLSYIETGFSSSGSDIDLDLVIGMGIDWHISDNFGLRFEWEQFQNVGDEIGTNLPSANRLELNGQDVNEIAIGFVYNL